MKRIFILSALLLSLDSFAQFNKFKSRTKLSDNAKDQAAANDKQQDYFGRGGTGIPGSEAGASDAKYVNLNTETAFGPEIVTSFDFPDASLLDLTKHMQKLTGINIIIEKDIKGKVSIMAPSPITVGDAWKAYLTALNMNGYTLVKSGAFYKIVGSRDVRYTPTPIYTGDFTPETENYMMKIIPLKHIDGAEIARSFRPFMSRYGRVINIKQTNTIIVHDTGTNINRLLRLITFLDVQGYEQSLHIIKVKHSSAQEISKLLEEILKETRGSKKKSSDTNDGIGKIIAEPRTNSIIAMVTSSGLIQLRELVNKLDVPIAATGSGRVHVYYLNYGNSETLAKTLSSIVSNAAQSGSNSTRRTTVRRSSLRRSTNESSSLFSADVKITADKDNNALVVTASPTDWLTLKSVIAKLDIPRDQVYVEGMMMETAVGNGNTFGISILGAYGSGDAERFGFNGSSVVDLLSTNITNLSGLFVGGGTGKKVEIDVGGTTRTVNTVNGLIAAVASDNRTNVLATPQVLALDNVEAEFEVGESVPVAKTTNTANGTSQTSVEQQEVSLKLKITPQINKVTRFIKLKIDQKIEDFSNREVSTAGGGVATTIRSAVTEVVVRDRDTIAMGGLMRDKETKSISKVPLLGDIPVLGWLFKRQQKSREKVNLLFFLTPKIISPYDKASANTVKDLLNRRNAHIEKSIGKDDPFKSTVKGLYYKADKQAKQPLYDVNDVDKYQRSNENSSGIGVDNRPRNFDNDDTPDYQAIAEQAKKSQTGTTNTETEELPDIDETLILSEDEVTNPAPVQETTAGGDGTFSTGESNE